MAPKRPPLRFRIPIRGTRLFVRVRVFDEQAAMWKEIEEIHGERHSHEKAATIFAPGSPERGCVADVLFSWRSLRPSIAAHEAVHAAHAVAAALGKTTSPSSDEWFAAEVEYLTERIWLRTQAATL